VQAAFAPVVRRSTTYAVAVGGMLDQLFDQAIAEVVGRVDIDALLDRIDLTEIVLTRVDLDVVVHQVLGGLDEAEIASLVAKVDVNAIAGSLDVDVVLDQMDLTSVVLTRVDLVKVVDAVLEQMDLTTIVLNRVDLVRVVDAVLDQMDLIALANEIIEGVDLPEIIRDSTGSMASETVKGVRMQGIGADQAVDRAVGRLLLRRARTQGPASS
jgi:uncharacterized protein YjbI with pentapeptide repeats